VSTTSLPPPPFTATEARMLAVLGDGRAHAVGELLACLPDDLGTPQNVRVHVCAIRRRLPAGEDIACIRSRGRTYYQRLPLTAFAAAGAVTPP
jgi:hypothetical protein